MWEIDLPPGIMRNGTDLQSEGRWRDGNLIRWRDGAMQPVGGWQQRTGNLGGIPRASLAWSSNLGDRLMAFGMHDSLKVSTPSGAISDISPADLTPGNVAALDLVGFGMGPYGSEAFGMPRPEASISRPATTWSLDTWGENLIAVSTADQRILEWNLLDVAAPVANAPTCIAAVVSDERFVFALGADGELRRRAGIFVGQPLRSGACGTASASARAIRGTAEPVRTAATANAADGSTHGSAGRIHR